MDNFNGLEDMNELGIEIIIADRWFTLGMSGVGKSRVLCNVMHEFGHWAMEVKAQKKLVFCPVVSMDEEKLRKAIEISKTQRLSICSDPEVCESNNLRQIISNITTDYKFNNVLNPSMFEFFLRIDGYDLIDQTSADSKFADDVMALCFAFIKYILAFIRYLLSLKLIGYIVQALHRICYIPHSFIHGPGNADDEHSNPFHSITARTFSSRKGNVLLASLSPG